MSEKDSQIQKPQGPSVSDVRGVGWRPSDGTQQNANAEASQLASFRQREPLLPSQVPPPSVVRWFAVPVLAALCATIASGYLIYRRNPQHIPPAASSDPVKRGVIHRPPHTIPAGSSYTVEVVMCPNNPDVKGRVAGAAVAMTNDKFSATCSNPGHGAGGTSNALGQCTLANLPAGTYTLQVQSGTYVKDVPVQVDGKTQYPTREVQLFPGCRGL